MLQLYARVLQNSCSTRWALSIRNCNSSTISLKEGVFGPGVTCSASHAMWNSASTRALSDMSSAWEVVEGLIPLSRGHWPHNILLSVLVTLVLAVLLYKVLLHHRLGCLMAKVGCWHKLHVEGPADMSAELLAHSVDKVVQQEVLHWGKITYIGRSDLAAQVFNSSAFVNRLGSDHGLKVLGMFKDGVIWNNDEPDWQTKRTYFVNGIQELVTRPAHISNVKRVVIAAYKLTLAEHCQKAASALAVASGASEGCCSADKLPAVAELAAMPLSELAQTVAGVKLDLADGRDFFRLVTFRVTIALAFGLPVDALSINEALEIVHKVEAYFKAWNYFLLRPAWMYHLGSSASLFSHSLARPMFAVALTAVSKLLPSGWCSALAYYVADISAQSKHLQSVKSLQSAAAELICKAKCSVNDQALSKCFLDKLLTDQAAGKLSEASVQQLVLEMLLAGTDTSSVSLYYLMVGLAENPGLEQQLLVEVLDAVGNVSNLDDSSLAAKLPASGADDNMLQKCQAALSEAMRIKPVGPVSIRQATKPVTLVYSTPGGHASLHLQQDDSVIVSLATMHRDPVHFAEPARFDPFTNFSFAPASSTSFALTYPSLPGAEAGCLVEQAGSRVSAAATSQDNNAFRPFGHGRKGCVGMNLGWLEMKVMLACWLMTVRFRKAAASLNSMDTKWEVASQPTEPAALHARCVSVPGVSKAAAGLRCIYVVGPHGSGKTTLCNALMAALSSSEFQQATAGTKLSSSPGAAIHVTSSSQTGAAIAPAGPEVNTASSCGSSAYQAVAWPGDISFTPEIKPDSVKPSQTGFVLISEIARQVMKRHGISREQLCSNANSGTQQSDMFLQLQRLIASEQLRQEVKVAANGGCYVSDRAVIDPLAYTADRFGLDSPEVETLLAHPDTQQLLEHCRSPYSLVLLVPPFDGGMQSPIDDGVRMLTPTAGFSQIFQQVMQRLCIPYEIVRAVTVEERVTEVMWLAGLSAAVPATCMHHSHAEE